MYDFNQKGPLVENFKKIIIKRYLYDNMGTLKLISKLQENAIVLNSDF